MKSFYIILFALLSLGVISVLPNTVQAANYYTVLGSDMSKIIVTDGTSSYEIGYGWECYSSDFSAGETILIDSYFYPSWGDTIVVQGLFDTKTCDVTSSTKLYLKPYYVVEASISSSDNVILEDSYGDQYLVEYGIGCLSMWRYEGDTIYVDLGGSFLDGIGDEIYLFDSDDSCTVWDAEEIDISGSYYTPPTTYTPPSTTSLQCPANSSNLSGECVCNSGYFASGGVCITITKACQNDYGPHTYGSDGQCYCSAGYQWATDRKTCEPVPAVTEFVGSASGGGGTIITSEVVTLPDTVSCDRMVMGETTHFGYLTSDECYTVWQAAVEAAIKREALSAPAQLTTSVSEVAADVMEEISTSTPQEEPLQMERKSFWGWLLGLLGL